MYYPCSENKGADQLRGYREADLRLCFRICRLLFFFHEEVHLAHGIEMCKSDKKKQFNP